MISSTAARATSLFQFIDDQRPNPPLVNEAGESQPQNEQPQANDPDAKLVNVHGFDDLVDKIMSS